MNTRTPRSIRILCIALADGHAKNLEKAIKRAVRHRYINNRIRHQYEN